MSASSGTTNCSLCNKIPRDGKLNIVTALIGWDSYRFPASLLQERIQLIICKQIDEQGMACFRDQAINLVQRITLN